MQFSKEGLEDPQSDRAPNRRHGSDAYGETEPELVKIQRQRIDENKPVLQPVIGNKEVDGTSVSLASFQKPLSNDALGSNRETVAALTPEEVLNNGVSPCVLGLLDQQLRSIMCVFVCYHKIPLWCLNMGKK